MGQKQRKLKAQPQAREGAQGAQGKKMTRKEEREIREKVEQQAQPIGSRAGGVEDQYLRGRRDALRDLRASGGLGALGDAGYATEVLLMLPDGFVKAYERLFLHALRGPGGMTVMEGPGQRDKGMMGTGKALGRQGTVLGNQSRAQAQGGGKKYRGDGSGGVGIGSEDYLAAKARIDRSLNALAHEIARLPDEIRRDRIERERDARDSADRVVNDGRGHGMGSGDGNSGGMADSGHRMGSDEAGHGMGVGADGHGMGEAIAHNVGEGLDRAGSTGGKREGKPKDSRKGSSKSSGSGSGGPGSGGPGTNTPQCQGSLEVRSLRSGNVLRVVPCRRFLKKDWRFCPTCGTGV